MEASLDFVTRARRAYHEFRNPSHLGSLNAPGGQEPTSAEEVEAARAHPSLYPKITAIENQARLAEFRLLIGIVQDKSFTGQHGFQPNRRATASLAGRPAPNMGIYTTVCDSEIKAKRNFKGASRMINFCLGLQIVVAAALTALGAANGSHGAITAFGAINTVIAALMSYLKGSGLPNRLKYYQHEWHKVREYVEQRERDFYLGLPGLDVHEEVEKIRIMFENVRADIETNTPERFVSSNQLRQQPPTAAWAQSSHPGLQRPQPSFSTESIRKAWNEKEAEVQGAVHKAQAPAQGFLSNLSHLKDAMEDRMKDVGRLEKEMEIGAQEKKRDLEKDIHASVQEVGYFGKEIERNARAAASQQVADRSQQVDNAVAHASDAARSGVSQQRDYLNTALSSEKHDSQPPNPT